MGAGGGRPYDETERREVLGRRWEIIHTYELDYNSYYSEHLATREKVILYINSMKKIEIFCIRRNSQSS